MPTTPTFDNKRFTSPVYEVKINTVSQADAILEQVRLGFGSNLSTASFTLPRDFRIGGQPVLDDVVEITINGRFVFKGFITNKTDRVNEGGGLRSFYSCHSTIIDLTNKALFEATLDKGTIRFNVLRVKEDYQSINGRLSTNTPTSELLFRKSTDQILALLGIEGGPTDFPGFIDITDLTRLEAAELVLSKVGNAKLYHDMSTGETSVYNFGSGGFTTREFAFGRNILDFNIQESKLDTVNQITVIGNPTQVHKKLKISKITEGIDQDGRLALQFEVSGKNIRSVQVFGAMREKPIVRFNDQIQVSLIDFGATSLGNYSSSFGKEVDSNIRFTKGSTQNVTYNSSRQEVTFRNKDGSVKQRARTGDTFRDPETGEKLKVGFNERGEVVLTGQNKGQRTSSFTSRPDESASKSGSSTVTRTQFEIDRGRDFSFKNTNNYAETDLKLRPIIRNLSKYEVARQSLGAKIEYLGKDKIRVSLSEIPKLWFAVLKTGEVLNSRIGVKDTPGDPNGVQFVRVLLNYEFITGPIDVEFTIDEDPPVVNAGSGQRCRSITDSQYSILRDAVTGFDNTKDILKRMQTRADGELTRLKNPKIGGTIQVIGDETIDLRSSVKVDASTLEVASVTHNLVNGFTITVELTNETFFQQLVIPPLLRRPGVSQNTIKETTRKLSNIDFETSQIAQATRALAAAKETLDKNPQESGPFARYLE